MSKRLLIEIDANSWDEIVSLIEDVCGVRETDIEILQDYIVLSERLDTP